MTSSLLRHRKMSRN